VYRGAQDKGVAESIGKAARELERSVEVSKKNKWAPKVPWEVKKGGPLGGGSVSDQDSMSTEDQPLFILGKSRGKKANGPRERKGEAVNRVNRVSSESSREKQLRRPRCTNCWEKVVALGVVTPKS